jgi:hypothetical protein
MAAHDRLTALRLRAQRTLRRRRRSLAAVFAALAVIAGLGVLRTPSSADEAASGSPPDPTVLRTGEVAVPITLSSSGIARILTTGQVVDIVGVSEDASASVVVTDARILDIPDAGSALSGSNSAVVVVAVADRLALPLLQASSSRVLTVVIRERPPRH